MTDQQKAIAEKYALPERPFLHGMASAFDMLGILNHGKSEKLLANLQSDFLSSRRDIMSSAWSSVGETLYRTMKQHELLSRGNRSK